VTRAIFVTGTDTGVGKTHVACALLRALAQAGQRAVGMKPVASGARAATDGLRHADAQALMAASSVAAAYADVNPYVFAPAIAPHIAAEAAVVTIELTEIRAAFVRLAAVSDWLVIEGAGGWRVPLGEHHTMADIARELDLPVVMVVGMRLGCLNHALLTAEAVVRDGLRLLGWVANFIDPQMAAADANLATLCARIKAPLLASFPHATEANPFSAQVDSLARLVDKSQR
jgi:dethiobiotin synthetase